MSASSRRNVRAERVPDTWAEIAPFALIGGVGFILGLILITLMTGQSISPLVWYITRSVGMTTYILLWLSVATGLSLTTKLFGPVSDAGTALQLHRLATDLALAGVAIHVLTVAIDPTVPIGMVGTLLPMVSNVRQPWSDFGVLSAWGLILIALSFPARRWIGKDRWRALHYLTFGFWLLALVHGVGTGTDTRTLWAGGIYVISAASVVFLTVYRVLQARVGTGSQRTGTKRVTALDTSR
jgi:methionine sulfoxide reductase heme-binding subunit